VAIEYLLRHVSLTKWHQNAPRRAWGLWLRYYVLSTAFFVQHNGELHVFFKNKITKCDF